MDSSDGERPGTTTSASTPEPSHQELLEHDRVNLSYASAFTHGNDLAWNPAKHASIEKVLKYVFYNRRQKAEMGRDGLECPAMFTEAKNVHHTHDTIASHLVWIPKYRRKGLTGEVQKETKRLIEECCERQGLTLFALETDMDHLHVFVSAPPRWSPALIANVLKGYTSRYLRETFPQLKQVYGKEHLWTQRYYVGTAGAMSAETIKRYMKECQGK